jgi:hypothetical protein
MRNNRSYLNAVLTAIALLLGLNLLVQVTGQHASPGAALAQPADDENVTSPPFNSGEQRKQMIALLELLNRRVTSLEGKLDKGLNVKVTEMPPVQVDDRAGKSR